jgi:precorrin-6B methylase 2
MLRGLRGAVFLVLALALAACSPARASAPAAAPPDERTRDALRQPDAVLAALDLHPGDRVADVGAGDGYLSYRLAAAVGPSGRVVATEIDPFALVHLVRRGLREHRRLAPELRLVARDAPGLEPFGYNVILLAQVDQYLGDRAGYFRRLGEALAPGGRLVLANRTPHREGALADAARAGFVLKSEQSLPAQYVATFVKESP